MLCSSHHTTEHRQRSHITGSLSDPDMKLMQKVTTHMRSDNFVKIKPDKEELLAEQLACAFFSFFSEK